MADSTRNVLLEAHELIYGEREQDYGDPRINLEAIAQLWSAYLGQELYATDVCNLMVLLKMAREQTGGYKRDNVVDQAGYVGLKDRLQA